MCFPKLNVMQIFYMCAYSLVSFWKMNTRVSHCDAALPMFCCRMHFLSDFVLYICQRCIRCVKFFHCYIFLVDYAFYQYEVLLFIFLIKLHSNWYFIWYDYCFVCFFFLLSICLIDTFQAFISNFALCFVFSASLTNDMHLKCVTGVFILSDSLCLLIDEFNPFRFVVITMYWDCFCCVNSIS